MAGDLTIVLAPGRIDPALLLLAAKDALGAAAEGDLAALIVTEEACDDALREAVGPFSAISFWTQAQETVDIEPYVLALSKRLAGRKLLVAWATEFGGSSGWRVVEGGKVGHADITKDGGATVVKAAGIAALFGKPAEGFDVHKLAFGGGGVRLLPADEAGTAISKEEAERVLYDADPLLFSGAGELKSVRRPKPKRRARRMNTAVTELPEDWKGWAKGQLKNAASLPRVLAFLTERGTDPADAEAHCKAVLREMRDGLRSLGKLLLLLGLGLALMGAAWLLAPLAQRRGRIHDPLPKAVVIGLGAVVAVAGLERKLAARACDPDRAGRSG